MATIFSLLIATPPWKVSSGVTTHPFLTTKSAAIVLPFFFGFYTLLKKAHLLRCARSPRFNVARSTPPLT
jgi:hypothetical protein